MTFEYPFGTHPRRLDSAQMHMLPRESHRAAEILSDKGVRCENIQHVITQCILLYDIAECVRLLDTLHTPGGGAP